MKIDSFEFNFFGVKTYVVYDPATRDAAIIDPGMMNADECNALDSYIERNHLNVKYLINTHMHIDHLMADEYVANKYNVVISASADDEFLASSVAMQAAMFHLPGKFPEAVKIDRYLKDGDIINIGSGKLEVIAVPGHSPGSIALYDAADGFVVTGDALFAGSIGRTDLPRGNYSRLVKSVTDRLLTLPADTKVYPGHGPATTIGHERQTNPFL